MAGPHSKEVRTRLAAASRPPQRSQPAHASALSTDRYRHVIARHGYVTLLGIKTVESLSAREDMLVYERGVDGCRPRRVRHSPRAVQGGLWRCIQCSLAPTRTLVCSHALMHGFVSVFLDPNCVSKHSVSCAVKQEKEEEPRRTKKVPRNAPPSHMRVTAV